MEQNIKSLYNIDKLNKKKYVVLKYYRIENEKKQN